LDLDLGSIGIRQSRSSIRRLAHTPTRPPADTDFLLTGSFKCRCDGRPSSDHVRWKIVRGGKRHHASRGIKEMPLAIVLIHRGGRGPRVRIVIQVVPRTVKDVSSARKSGVRSVIMGITAEHQSIGSRWRDAK
jgi:hypothetical protein